MSKRVHKSPKKEDVLLLSIYIINTEDKGKLKEII